MEPLIWKRPYLGMTEIDNYLLSVVTLKILQRLNAYYVLYLFTYLFLQIYGITILYANDDTSVSEGSFFHGMKVLAMPLRRFGTA